MPALARSPSQAGGLLLLRLLAWKRINLLMGPLGSPGGGPLGASGGLASSEALRFVGVMGSEGAGKSTLFNSLTGLPHKYKVRAALSRGNRA